MLAAMTVSPFAGLSGLFCFRAIDKAGYPRQHSYTPYVTDSAMRIYERISTVWPTAALKFNVVALYTTAYLVPTSGASELSHQ